MYINNPGHMTKMAAMPIYGRSPSKIFYRTGRPISTKLNLAWSIDDKKYNNVYNNDPVKAIKMSFK